MILMVPWLGLIGAALARLCSIPTSTVARTILHYKVLNDRRWYAGINIFAPVVFSFMFAVIVQQMVNEFPLALPFLLPLLTITSLVSCLIAIVLCKFFNSEPILANNESR